MNDTIFFAIIANPEHCDVPKLKALLVEDLKQKLKEDLVKQGSKEEVKEGEAEETVEKKLLIKKGLQFDKEIYFYFNVKISFLITLLMIFPSFKRIFQGFYSLQK